MLEKATSDDNDLRRQAAEAALPEVKPGMKLGLGTGRTAEHFVRLLAARVQDGLKTLTVPTSERTGELARALGIPTATLDDEPELDLTVDGADEVDPKLRLIKGGGGALLREKIVAAASAKLVVIVDGAKMVPVLGAHPLPIEVVPFGLAATRRAISEVSDSLGLAGTVALRTVKSQPFLTDGGHYILDASFGRIDDPNALAGALSRIPGVVEHGLFIDLAGVVIVARTGGIERLSPKENKT